MKTMKQELWFDLNLFPATSMSVDKDGGAAALVLPVACRLISSSSPAARFTAGFFCGVRASPHRSHRPESTLNRSTAVLETWTGKTGRTGGTAAAHCLSPPCCVHSVSLCELSPLTH